MIRLMNPRQCSRKAPPADACNAPDPTHGEQSVTLPTADSYSFADGFETKTGRQNCRPVRMLPGGAVHFCTPLNRTGEQILTDEKSGVEIEKTQVL